MKTEIVPFKTEEEWLVERAKDVTSTEVSALPGIDVNPYFSPWELFQRKKTGDLPEFEVSERMRWGNRLQDAIAEAAAERLNLDYKRIKDYIRIPEYRIGASFDYFVKEGAGTADEGIMEVKNVDSLQFHQNWREDADGFIEAPPHIELQVQHQLFVSRKPYAYLAVLVGGNTLKVARRGREENVGRIIVKKVAEFWAMVRDDTPPPPDFTRDAKLIAALYNRSTPGEVLDLTEDKAADEMVWIFKQYQQAYADAENKIAEYRARILARIGTAEKALGKHWTISAMEVAPVKGTKVTKEMVGTYIGARKGFRGLRVNLKKEEEAAT